MNAIDTEPRGQTGNSDSRRSFPVLFHLQDISRHRTVRPPIVPPPLQLESPPEEANPAPIVAAPLAGSPAAELPPPQPAAVPITELRLPAEAEPSSSAVQNDPSPLAAEIAAATIKPN